ncbi:MAG: hypothetical protein ABSA92_14835 [Candidatus Bathyarchaeia archaeon]
MNANYKMWKWIRSAYSNLDFYGMTLHDPPWNYYAFNRGRNFTPSCQRWPGELTGIMYAKANQKLDTILRDYISSKFGQIVPNEYDEISDRYGEFSLYRESKTPYGVLEIEVTPFTTRKTMMPEETADRLSDLLSYIFRRL